MTVGDPDMTGDELQAAMERALATRRELRDTHPTTRSIGNVIAALPQAAELYRRQIAEGLDGSPLGAAKPRLLLREIFGGNVPLKRQGAELWAQITLRPGALLLRAACTDGSGGALLRLEADWVEVELW